MTKLVFKNIGSSFKVILIIIFISMVLGTSFSYSQTYSQAAIENMKNTYRRLGFSESRITQILKESGYITDEEELISEQPEEKTGISAIDSLIKLQNQIKILQQEILIEEGLIEIPEKEIKPFGYDIFNWKPTTFEPPAFGSITPDYIVGPGDEVKVEMWGQTSLNESFIVDRRKINRDLIKVCWYCGKKYGGTRCPYCGQTNWVRKYRYLR